MIQIEEEVLDTFGKIIYAIAKSDGEVQDEEVEVIRKVIDNHEWAQELELSFAVEKELDMDYDEVFEDAMRVFASYDVKAHYDDFLDLLEKIAEAHDGVVNEERELIDRFKQRLFN
ncbi:MAG: hypothetical protein JXR07_09680 [Reichenbachiella sp.]